MSTWNNVDFPDPDRPTTCLEDLAGGAALGRRARADVAAGAMPVDWLRRWGPSDGTASVTARDLGRARADGEPWGRVPATLRARPGALLVAR